MEANQLGLEGRREHLGDLGLADAGLALEEQRPLELQREKDRSGQPALGDVVESRKDGLEIVD